MLKMDPSNTKKYIVLDNILAKINQKYISLPETDRKINTAILESVITQIINKMRGIDTTFDNMFERRFYGGSYYDNTKICKPEEFDIDLVLNLPSLCKPKIVESKIPGFVNIEIMDIEALAKDAIQSAKYLKLTSFMDDRYISVLKILKWIESILNRALNEFIPSSESEPVISANVPDANKTQSLVLLYPKIMKQGPAFTLKISGMVNNSSVNFDVDLVPCFQFSDHQWPSCQNGHTYRRNNTSKPKFFLVPKQPKNCAEDKLSLHWRLSFQDQESALMTGACYRGMKSAIKLLKKLRDQQNHAQIASYYIKTIFLWEIQNQDVSFWSNSLSFVFMTMLYKYTEMIASRNIPFYWNENNNLIEHVKAINCDGIANQLKRIIRDVEDNLQSNPFAIGKYLISSSDFKALQDEVSLGKKANIVNNLPIRPLVTDATNISAVRVPEAILQTQTSEGSKVLDEVLREILILRQENKTILEVCQNLVQKVTGMEEQISNLSSENRELKMLLSKSL